jgi:phosphoglycolate phosphatase
LSRIGILFDLDGTLADTAPDLVAVLNTLLREAGLAPVPYAIARNEVSNGAVGLIRLGFSLEPAAEVDAGTRQAFLDLYETMGHTNSRLFIALEDLYKLFDEFDAAWGIVTNKPESLTHSLLDYLGIRELAGTIVCGDTLVERKPHPAPLLHAAREIGLPGERCIYIGDARRDIQAGRAAGMRTIATSYGYIRPGEDVPGWQADAIAGHPRRIRAVLQQISETL